MFLEFVLGRGTWPASKFSFSPGDCSLAPHILLPETEVAFEPIATSVFEGAQLTEAFAQINPKKRLPALALDGQMITEVPAIATALLDLAPERHLMGRTLIERARVYEWMNWLSGTLHGQGFGAMWRPERFSDDTRLFESIHAKGRSTTTHCFEIIEDNLLGPHAVGDSFTAVDPYLLVLYCWGNGIGVDMASTYPSYAGLTRRFVQWASVVSTLAADGDRRPGALRQGRSQLLFSRITASPL